MSNAKTMTIADVMTKSVISVDSSVTAGDAAKMMEDAKVGTVIVMENNAPMGIVTDRDFAIKVVASFVGASNFIIDCRNVVPAILFLQKMHVHIPQVAAGPHMGHLLFPHEQRSARRRSGEVG